MKFTISFALISVLAVCQVKSQNIGKIIGPTLAPAEVRDINNVALFERSRPNSPFCSGALISYEWILTAASCVKDKYEMNVRAKVGSKSFDAVTLPDTHFTSAETVHIIYHPQYNALSLANDIALLKLTNRLEKNSVLPYTLTAKNDNWIGKIIIVRGFGGLEPYVEQSGALSLSEMRTTVQPITECRKEITNIPFNKICSRTGRICLADQGGAVLLEGSNALIGIVSTPSAQRETCGTTATAQTYTNIVALKSWLQTNTGIHIP